MGAKVSKGEMAMWAQLKRYPGWVQEYRFAPPRRWRFDFAYPATRLAVEIDGGSGFQGHGQVWNRAADYEKNNEAICRGWRVIRGTTEQAENGQLLEFVKRCLHN